MLGDYRSLSLFPTTLERGAVCSQLCASRAELFCTSSNSRARLRSGYTFTLAANKGYRRYLPSIA
jgi:hypothetical protein